MRTPDGYVRTEDLARELNLSVNYVLGMADEALEFVVMGEGYGAAGDRGLGIKQFSKHTFISDNLCELVREARQDG